MIHFVIILACIGSQRLYSFSIYMSYLLKALDSLQRDQKKNKSTSSGKAAVICIEQCNTTSYDKQKGRTVQDGSAIMKLN